MPPLRAPFPVAGRSAHRDDQGASSSTCATAASSARTTSTSASLIAEVVCGGDVEAGSLVDEEYLMALERKRFCELLEHPKTQERIMGMLQTGKPVRN